MRTDGQGQEVREGARPWDGGGGSGLALSPPPPWRRESVMTQVPGDLPRQPFSLATRRGAPPTHRPTHPASYPKAPPPTPPALRPSLSGSPPPAKLNFWLLKWTLYNSPAGRAPQAGQEQLPHSPAGAPALPASPGPVCRGCGTRPAWLQLSRTTGLGPGHSGRWARQLEAGEELAWWDVAGPAGCAQLSPGGQVNPAHDTGTGADGATGGGAGQPRQ